MRVGVVAAAAVVATAAETSPKTFLLPRKRGRKDTTTIYSSSLSLA